MNGISRRTLLKQLAVGGLLAAVPVSRAWSAAPDLFGPLATRLVNVLSSTHSAEVIGQRYLALATEPANVSVLAARVAGDTAGYLRLCSAGSQQLRALLAQQQRSDFAEGRTVNVDGWILSVTEARVCAIAAVTGKMGETG
jgi:hypothetical protein